MTLTHALHRLRARVAPWAAHGWRAWLVAMGLLAFLLVQHGGWLHALGHAQQELAGVHGHAKPAQPDASGADSACLVCQAFGAQGHAAPPVAWSGVAQQAVGVLGVLVLALGVVRRWRHASFQGRAPPALTAFAIAA